MKTKPNTRLKQKQNQVREKFYEQFSFWAKAKERMFKCQEFY